MKIVFKDKLKWEPKNTISTFQSVQGKPKYTFAVAKDQSRILYPLQFLGLIGCGVLSCLGYIQLYRLGDLKEKVPEFFFFYVLIGIIYFNGAVL